MLSVSCPRCASKMRAPEEFRGKTAKCGSCGNKFLIDGSPDADIELRPIDPPPSPNSPPPLPPKKQWHYASDGERRGPVTSSEMSSLISSGQVTRTTLVWSEGMGDWKQAAQTDLLNSSTPPPLTGKRVANGIAWVLALLPFVYFPLIAYAIADARNAQQVVENIIVTLILFMIPTVGLSFLDFWRVSRAGYPVPLWYWILPVPVYLFLRASLTGQRPDYAYTWVLGMALWILAATPIIFALPIVALCLLLAVILMWTGAARGRP
jgi:hypothetical protein